MYSRPSNRAQLRYIKIIPPNRYVSSPQDPFYKLVYVLKIQDPRSLAVLLRFLSDWL